jgi:uncharacterized protein DUF4421
VKIFTYFILLQAIYLHACGQTLEIKHEARDKAYIKDYYKTHLIIRAYESSRFNNFKLVDGSDKLIYKPNHHNDLGLGFTYKIISFNFEFYIPGLGQDNDRFGITHSFDVQTYIYIHKFVVDFYSQFYDGYYLANGNQALAGNQPSVVKRPDITTKDISLLCQYVFNDEHFSFNGPFYQNEIQLKSAGSFQLGGGIYHNDGHADSSFIPSLLKKPDFFHGYNFNGFSFTGIGPNSGYAYTLVIHRHFFATSSASAGIGIGDAVVSGGIKDSRIGMEYMFNGKFAAGYTNDKYFIGVTYLRLVTEINCVAARTWQQESTGNFRFTIAKRFHLRKNIIPKSNVIKID